MGQCVVESCKCTEHSVAHLTVGEIEDILGLPLAGRAVRAVAIRDKLRNEGATVGPTGREDGRGTVLDIFESRALWQVVASGPTTCSRWLPAGHLALVSARA